MCMVVVVLGSRMYMHMRISQWKGLEVVVFACTWWHREVALRLEMVQRLWP